jgi:hypothetical protein
MNALRHRPPPPGRPPELAAGIVDHNGCALIPWRFVGPNGVVTLEGLNFDELTPEGLLKRVVQRGAPAVKHRSRNSAG